MIVSKSNLQVVNVTKLDKNIPALDNVHLAEDGSTVAIGGKMALVVSPVDDKAKKKIENVIEDEGAGGITISSDTVKQIIKDMPADRKFGGLLEHCNIKKLGNGTDVRVTTTDGKRKRSIVGKLFDKDFLPYRELFKVAIEKSNSGDSKRIVLNLKRLLILLQTIEKVAPDTSGDNPIWIEFTDNDYVIIRGVNMITGQRCVGVMNSYKNTEGKWLEVNEWERSFLYSKKLKKKLKIKRKVGIKLKIKKLHSVK